MTGFAPRVEEGCAGKARARLAEASNLVRFHLPAEVFRLPQRQGHDCRSRIGCAGCGHGAAVGNKQIPDVVRLAPGVGYAFAWVSAHAGTACVMGRGRNWPKHHALGRKGGFGKRILAGRPGLEPDALCPLPMLPN